jgi:predicted RNase H-like HicB family nuclease
MRQIIMTIHREDDSWCADSPSLPGFYAAGDSIDDLRVNIREGVAFELDDAPHAIVETSIEGWKPWADASSSGQALISSFTEQFGYVPQKRPAARPRTNAPLALA